MKSQPLQQRRRKISTRGNISTGRGYLKIQPPPPVTTHDFSHTQRTPALLRSLNMGLENDADLKRMEAELKRERERVARLEKEVKERMRREAAQKNSRTTGKGR